MDTLENNQLRKTLGSYFRHEGTITRFGWVIMAILVVEDFVARLVTTQTVTGFALLAVQLVLYAGFVLTGVLKLSQIGVRNQDQSSLYKIAKYLEIGIMTIFISLMYHGSVFYFIVLLPLISIILSRGFKESLRYILLGWLTQTLSVCCNIPFSGSTNRILHQSIYALISIAVQYLLFAFCGYILGSVQDI